eukprot:5028507-Pyramimonas_sp.AAC.1
MISLRPGQTSPRSHREQALDPREHVDAAVPAQTRQFWSRASPDWTSLMTLQSRPSSEASRRTCRPRGNRASGARCRARALPDGPGP